MSIGIYFQRLLIFMNFSNIPDGPLAQLENNVINYGVSHIKHQQTMISALQSCQKILLQ